MLLFVAVLVLLVQFLSVCSSSVYEGNTIVIDAGSSGSRFYLLNQTKERGAVSSQLIFQLEGGLSAQSQNMVFEYLKPGLMKVIQVLSTPLHNNNNNNKKAKVYLYGTAGMRLLPTEQQKTVYENICEGAEKHEQVNSLLEIDCRDESFRTISGEEEAYFAILAINYLGGTISNSLQPEKVPLFGALEMGGASTQLIFDLRERWRQVLRRGRGRNRKPLDATDFYRHSFLGYGINSIQKKISTKVTRTEGKNMHPCYFQDFSSTVTPQGAQAFSGSGNAIQCMKILMDLADEDNKKCPTNEGVFCALQGAIQPVLYGKFYAVGVFYVAVDFAREAIEFAKAKNMVPSTEKMFALSLPNPTLTELEKAARIVCGLPMSNFISKNSKQLFHSLTPPENLPRRCLDLCYITVILKRLKFDMSDRRVNFANTINGKVINWPLGAYLYKMLMKQRQKYELHVASLHSQIDAGVPYGRGMSILLLSLALIFLYTTVYTSRNKDGSPLLFINDASE